MVARRCKDCGPPWKRSVRAAPHPGPRCATHHRAAKKRASEKAHDAHISRTYAVPRGFYKKLLVLQGGKCAICQKARGRARRLALDHRHSDGRPRGALCSVCNRMLGYYRDDPIIFRRAAEYLEHPPADRLEGDA